MEPVQQQQQHQPVIVNPFLTLSNPVKKRDFNNFGEFQLCPFTECENRCSITPVDFAFLSKFLHSFQILRKIFSNIRPKSLQRIRAVCSNWKIEIERGISIGVEVNNDIYIWTLNNWNTGSARIRNFTLEFSDYILFAETISQLEFCDIVISYNLIRFLMECNMVKILKFNNVMLDNERGMKCPEGLTLPNVKALHIDLKCHVFPTADEIILINFLQQVDFGQLEKLVIRSAISSADKRVPKLPYKIKSTAFLEFMIKNSESLKQILISGPELRLLGQPIEDFTGMIEFVQAEEFNYSFRNAGISTGNESLMLECQTNLKKIDVQVDFQSWPALEKAIKASGEVLTDAKVGFIMRCLLGDIDETPVFVHRDAGIFKECSKLENLKIGNDVNTVQIVNLDTLPGTIQRLEVGGPVTWADLLIITTRLRQLKEFSLIHNFALEDTFGFTVFGSFVSIPTFRKLILKRSRFDKLSIMTFCKSREGISATFSESIGDPDYLGTLTCIISSKFFELNKAHEPQAQPEIPEPGLELAELEISDPSDEDEEPADEA
jgi:hypothetical protein